MAPPSRACLESAKVLSRPSGSCAVLGASPSQRITRCTALGFGVRTTPESTPLRPSKLRIRRLGGRLPPGALAAGTRSNGTHRRLSSAPEPARVRYDAAPNGLEPIVPQRPAGSFGHHGSKGIFSGSVNGSFLLPRLREAERRIRMRVEDDTTSGLDLGERDASTRAGL